MENRNLKNRRSHGFDPTEDQPADQNNNGNIGREESSNSSVDQNPSEKGQFGTTAEKGSGALESPQAYTAKKGREGYNQTENSGTYGRSQQEIDQNWAQGTEGSPGEGYQDDRISGRSSSRGESNYPGSDKQGLTDRFEGQSGNFADRNADQEIQPPRQITNVPEKRDDVDLSEDDRTRDELI